MYIISACLLGENCKYTGGSNYTKWVIDLASRHNYISVCPEILGGLEAPRPPVEIIEGRAVNADNVDVTREFAAGVQAVWAQVMEKKQRLGEEIEGAVLKAKSPSCGAGKIYDGTFSHTVIDGDGFLAAFLREKGIKIITEEEEYDD